MPIKIGLIGKTNTGKTTFFNAATLSHSEVSTYPFTTKKPERGMGNAITPCVHTELNVQDQPQNSKCSDGWKFLSVATQSDALLHVVDVSGSVDSSGKITEVGNGDPISDVADIEEELIMWYLKLLEGNRDKISKLIHSDTEQVVALTDVFRGIGVKEYHVKDALKATKLEDKHFDNFDVHDSKKFASYLRHISKPTLIVANKIDLPVADKNFDRLRERYFDSIVVPASADSELSLRRAEHAGLIKYVPGSEQFEILQKDKLNKKQTDALDFITKDILGEYRSEE